MIKEEFLIGELSKKAGVSVRTIRYYVDQDLLPAPDSRGRYACFSQDHLHRLELIKKLKELHLTLEEIKQTIASANEQELLRLLKSEAQSTPRANFFASEITPEEPGKAALEYLSKIKTSRYLFRVADSEPSGAPRLSKISATAGQETGTTRQTWERIQLAPGVELSYQSTTDPETLRRIQQLIKFSEALFEQKYGGKK